VAQKGKLEADIEAHFAEAEQLEAALAAEA
jgi:hypothetical protein